MSACRSGTTGAVAHILRRQLGPLGPAEVAPDQTADLVAQVAVVRPQDALPQPHRAEAVKAYERSAVGAEDDLTRTFDVRQCCDCFVGGEVPVPEVAVVAAQER